MLGSLLRGSRSYKECLQKVDIIVAIKQTKCCIMEAVRQHGLTITWRNGMRFKTSGISKCTAVFIR